MDDCERQRFQSDLAKRGLELGEHVRLSRTIPAAAINIWNLISKPGELAKYHPYCCQNSVFKWPGVGSRDGVAYHSGLYFERDFMYWREGAGFDLQIGPPPRKTAWISWNIEPLGDSHCELSIMVTPILDSHLLETTKKNYTQRFFGQSMVIYLDSLLQGVDYFVTTGQVVQQRQFGTHPIYAP